MPLKTRATLCLLICLVAGNALATISAKGVGSVAFATAAGPAEKAEAVRLAKVNALERHFAETDQAQQKNYEGVRGDIVAHIDEYILSTQVLSETEDAATKQYTVVLRAEINDLRLSSKIASSSATAATPAGQRSMLTFLFVTREQAAVQVFDERVSKRVDTSGNADTSAQGSHEGTEGERVKRSEVSTHESETATTSATTVKSAVVTTGGSATQKADAVSWRVGSATELNSIVTGVFSAAGFEVVEAEFIEGIDVEAFRTDYSSADNPSPGTLRAAAAGALRAEVPYLVIGTMDVGMRDKDPTTGLNRIYVTVMGKVLDVTGKFPKTVSSVGPIQFAGTGPTDMVARTNALSLAGEKATTQLMSELNAKAVR